MSERMRAIVVHQHGGPEVLRLEAATRPSPRDGEVLLRIEAAGANFIDVYQRTGRYPTPLPFIPGNEAAGVVHEVGDGVRDFAVGDRVAFATARGAFAEYAVVYADRLVAVPDDVSTRDAAAILLQGLTAHYLTRSTWKVKAGQWVLVHAAAGGVGLLLCQMASAAGARVIGTVSTEEKAALARAAGAHHTILYTQSDFLAEVKEITDGRGVDVVYDSVGRDTFDRSLDALQPRGMLVLFGGSSGAVQPVDPMRLNRGGSLFLTRPALAHYAATPEELRWRAGELFDAVRAGTVRIRIHGEFALEDAADAFRALEGRATAGKLVLLSAG